MRVFDSTSRPAGTSPYARAGIAVHWSDPEDLTLDSERLRRALHMCAQLPQQRVHALLQPHHQYTRLMPPKCVAHATSRFWELAAWLEAGRTTVRYRSEWVTVAHVVSGVGEGSEQPLMRLLQRKPGGVGGHPSQ